MVSSFPRLHARTMWKPQKASHFHNVTIDDAEAAVMSTRQGLTQAFIIYYHLSEQKVTFYLIIILTVQILFEMLFQKLTFQNR